MVVFFQNILMGVKNTRIWSSACKHSENSSTLEFHSAVPKAWRSKDATAQFKSALHENS